MVFYRHFQGNSKPELEVLFGNDFSLNECVLHFKKNTKKAITIVLNNLYDNKKTEIVVNQSEKKLVIDLSKTKGWYDLKIDYNYCSWHFSGRIETGAESITDPHWR
jgi:phospholipase C